MATALAPNLNASSPDENILAFSEMKNKQLILIKQWVAFVAKRSLWKEDYHQFCIFHCIVVHSNCCDMTHTHHYNQKGTTGSLCIASGWRLSSEQQKTDLRFDSTGLTGASCWLESEVLFKSGLGQNACNLSINSYHFIALWNTHPSDIICTQKLLSCSHIAAFTDLESILTVELKVVLYSGNVAIIHGLTSVSVAFRDLEQAVCGRDKFEVTCDDKLFSKSVFPGSSQRCILRSLQPKLRS